MHTKIVFRDIHRTDNLEEYLLAQTKELVEGYFRASDQPQIQVTVYEDRHRNGDGRRVHFVCEILLRANGRSPMKIRKSSFDFYECVAEAGSALRNQVRRDHRYQLSKRRSYKDHWQRPDLSAA